MSEEKLSRIDKSIFEEKLSRIDKSILLAKKKQEEIKQKIQARICIVTKRIEKDTAILDSLHASFESL